MQNETKTEQILADSHPLSETLDDIEQDVVLTIPPKSIRTVRARFVIVPRAPEELTIDNNDIAGIVAEAEHG